MNPVNYTQQFNPADAYGQGVAIKSQLQANDLRAAELGMEQQRQDRLTQQQSRFFELAKNPYKSPEEINEFIALSGSNPSSKAMFDALKNAKEEDKTELQSAYSKIVAAGFNGDIETSKKGIEGRIKFLEQSGDNETEINLLNGIRTNLDVNPDAALDAMTVLIAGSGGKDLVSSLKSLQETRKTRAEVPFAGKEAEAKASLAETQATVAANTQQADIIKKQNDALKSMSDAKIAQEDALIRRAENEMKVKQQKLNYAKSEDEKLKLAADIEAAKAKTAGIIADRSDTYTKQQNTIGEALALVKDLKSPEKRDALQYATGWSSNLYQPKGSAAYDVAYKMDTLKNLLTVDNMKLMSGVLTEKDIALLQNVSSMVDRGLPTKTILDEFDRVENKLIEAQSAIDKKYSGWKKATEPTQSTKTNEVDDALGAYD